MLFGTALRGQVNVSRARQNREASSLSRHTHGSTQLTCEHVNEMYKQVKLSIVVPQDGCKLERITEPKESFYMHFNDYMECYRGIILRTSREVHMQKKKTPS